MREKLYPLLLGIAFCVLLLGWCSLTCDIMYDDRRQSDNRQREQTRGNRVSFSLMVSEKDVGLRIVVKQFLEHDSPLVVLIIVVVETARKK